MKMLGSLAGLGLLMSLSPASLAAGPRITVGADVVAVTTVDGRVYAWGQGSEGQLGDGRRTSSSRAQPVPGLSGIVDIVAADGAFAALKVDGTVWLWGSGSNGLFGSTLPESTIRSTVPVMIPELAEVYALALGRNGPAAWAADSAGQVWHWGSNVAGQAGDGSTSGSAAVRRVPQLVAGLADISVLAAADDGFMAGAYGGGVWGWGANETGALGPVARTVRGGPPLAAQPVPGAGSVLGLATLDVNENAWFAVQRDGSVHAWGTNRSFHAGCGQVSSATPVITSPRPIAGLEAVVAQAGGGGHALFVDGAGLLRGCGRNSEGQLGDGSTSGVDLARPGPLTAVLPAPAVAVGAGRNASAAVTLDGRVWVWGSLSAGAAGDGGPVNGTRVQTTPLAVTAATGGGGLSAGDPLRQPILVAGTQTGPLARATVDAGIAPLPGDVGQGGWLFLVVVLPDGSAYDYDGSTGEWAPLDPARLHGFRPVVLTRHVPTRLFAGADLGGLAGLTFHLGYGVGATPDAARLDLVNGLKFGLALTLRD